jgi:hypothetical protein
MGNLQTSVSGGIITATNSRIRVGAQTGTADDLDTIQPDNVPGSILIFLRAVAGDTITVKHGTGNISTIDGNDYDLTGDIDMILLYILADNTWFQMNYLPGQALPASSIASGTLAHERGGLEADVSAYDGLVGITGGATFQEALPLGADVGGTGADNSTNNEGDTLLSNGANGNYVTSPLPTTLRNRVLDPRFDYWPEDTSDTLAGGSSYASVWGRLALGLGGGSSTCAWSRQAFAVGQTDVPHNPTYFLRLTGSVSGGDDDEAFWYDVVFEDVRTYAGETITLSVWLDGSAAQTIAAVPFQNFGSGGSASVYGTGQEFGVTTDWQRLHLTFAIPSISGQTIGAGSFLTIRIFKQAGSTRATTANLPNPIAATGTVDFWGLQVDRGSIMTAFDDRPIALEQRLLERYFFRFVAGVAAGHFASAHCFSTTQAFATLRFPTEMRTLPSISTGGDFKVEGPSAIDVTGITVGLIGLSSVRVSAEVASGLTVGRAVALRAGSDADSFIQADARF